MANKNAETTKYVRAPIVTVMGHVDHGKTSILDALRKTNVQQKEYGGITQHIGAYQITHNSQKITFIDTPGHAAFSQMRMRGGKAADIVVLVVAADDGVMPQTVEAISHAKAAGVPMIVAINKIDKPGADVQKVKQGLSEHSILVEDWGGDVICVEVSATTGKNLDKLLDSILVLAELLELKANPDGDLEAIIIEARKDKRRGVVVTAIIKNGSLTVGTAVSAGGIPGKIKSMMDASGNMLKVALPSMPVELLGFKDVPNVGDLMVEEGSELAELAVDESRVEIIGKETKRTIGIVLKADTQGTLEAVKASLAEIVTSNVGADYSLKFLLSGTGDITDSDVTLAKDTGGIVVGFNVGVISSSAEIAEIYNVPLKTYKAIYELIEEVSEIIEGTAHEEESRIKGRAQILKLFKLESGDVVLGSRVLAGALKEGSFVAIYDKNPSELTQNDEPLYRGQIKKLKQGKEEADLVGKNVECGVLLKPQFDAAAPDQYIEVTR